MTFGMVVTRMMMVMVMLTTVMPWMVDVAAVVAVVGSTAMTAVAQVM
jgi:hypothetical protein